MASHAHGAVKKCCASATLIKRRIIAPAARRAARFSRIAVCLDCWAPIGHARWTNWKRSSGADNSQHRPLVGLVRTHPGSIRLTLESVSGPICAFFLNKPIRDPTYRLAFGLPE